MQNLKPIIITVTLSLILLVGAGFASFYTDKSNAITPSAASQVTLESTNYDWGDIGINNGKVEHSFTVSNQSEEPLTIYDVSTSCMCTSAILFYKGDTSPLFGMHTNASYSLDIAPGSSADLRVIFDPAFHGPNGVGPITRQVFLKTNDISNQELVFMLTANVTR